MMPRVQAQESIDRATAVAVGTGSTEQGAAILRDWRHLAHPPPPRVAGAQRPQSREHVERMGQMGYGIKKVEARAVKPSDPEAVP